MAKKHYSTKMPRGPIMNALGATAKECKRKATISAIEGTHFWDEAEENLEI